MTGYRIRGWMGVWIVGVVLTAGCQMMSRNREEWTESGPSDAATSLSESQVSDVQVALGRALENRGELRQAMEVYAEAVRKDPTRADAWARMALLADKQGMFTESGEYYRRALELAPQEADIHCNLGYSLYLQQRWSEAEAALRQAIALKPDHQRAQNNLGLVLARSGRHDEALTAFQSAGISAIDARLNLAYAMTLNGDWTAARGQYQAVLVQQPSSEVAKKGLATVNALAGKPAPARPSAQEVVPVAASKPAQP